ncbi:tetratricopeptide repeat protein [Microseira wollei]|uniref:tetratricopeptide repeat protein n=1 Tax=Microseira wollei TaxID=467598 RepID=UPI001CFE8353|nr:tetratricopeptide repeat protein [Microseira wollei]
MHSNKEGQHSEIIVISGDRLKQLRDFCWEMAEKYKRNSPVRQLFINNLKGKLGEEVVKARLAELVTEVDYEKRLGGDGKVDFRLASNQNFGIQVKSRHGSLETVQWSITSEEVEKNSILICILIQEEVSEAQTQYHLILAGFLPTNMIELKKGQASVRIEQLLYGGGLVGYLSNLSLFQADSLLVTLQNIKQQEQQASIKNQENSTSESESCESIAYSYLSAGTARLGKNTHRSIADFDEAIRCNPSESKAYYYRGLAYDLRGFVQEAIEDFTQALRLVPDYTATLYGFRASAYSAIGDRQRAIEDYRRAILINPENVAVYYWFRGKQRFKLGDYHGAIEDYNQAIQLRPLVADLYESRASAYAAIENKKAAIEDCDRIIQSKPDSFESYLIRGDILSKFGDYKRAIEDYTEAIRLCPTFSLLYDKRGSARSEIRDKQGAISDFQQAADLYQQQRQQSFYEEVMEKIRKLQQ